jgi:phosphoribosyl-dephospho-CoA transferase
MQRVIAGASSQKGYSLHPSHGSRAYSSHVESCLSCLGRHKIAAMGEAEQVRQYAYQNYILPARQKKLLTVTFSAGPIHKALKLQRLMPCVCDALDTALFERQYNIKKVGRTTPKHGPTATWTFSI